MHPNALPGITCRIPVIEVVHTYLNHCVFLKSSCVTVDYFRLGEIIDHYFILFTQKHYIRTVKYFLSIRLKKCSWYLCNLEKGGQRDRCVGK